MQPTSRVSNNIRSLLSFQM